MLLASMVFGQGGGAVSLNPQTLWDMLQNGKAAEVLDIPSDSGDALWHWNRCRALIELNRYREAVADGKLAWSLRDQLSAEEQAVVCLDYAYALGYVGDYFAAIAVARAGVDIPVTDQIVRIRIRENLGHWLDRAGERAEAIRWLRVAQELAKSPGLAVEHGRLLYLIGRCLLSSGDVAEAGSYLASARSILEEHNSRKAAFAQVYYGLYKLTTGDLDDAWKWAQLVIQRCSQSQPDVATLGWYLLAEVAERRDMAIQAQEMRHTAQCLAMRMGRDDLINEGQMFRSVLRA